MGRKFKVLKTNVPRGLKRGYAVRYTGYDGERHTARKIFRNKEAAEKWARGCPPAWHPRVIKVKKKRR